MLNMAEITDKIAKLLALAESPNENEARAALLKARELMAAHKLRPEEITRKETVKVIKRTVGVTCTKMTNTWAVQLSAIVAEHYCCKAYRNHRHGDKKVTIGIVGLEDDFEVAERIFRYAFDCVDARCKEIRAYHKGGWPADIIRQRCNAYGAGFCKGLQDAFRAHTQQHQEWGLVLVTPKAVTDAMSDMGKGSGYGNVDAGGSNRDFLHLGYDDGRKFDPSTRLDTPQRRTAIGQ